MVLLSEKEKKDRGGADGHVLAISDMSLVLNILITGDLPGIRRLSRLRMPGINI